MYATHQAARNEFEVLLVSVCLFLGFAQVFYAEVPLSIRDTPTEFQLTWAFTMLIGSAVTLVGIAWRDVYTGLVLELAGLLALGGVMLTYAGIVILSSAEAPSLVGVPITMAFAVAAFRRSWKIGRKIFNKKERQQSLLNEIISRKAVDAVRDTDTGELPLLTHDEPDDNGSTKGGK